MGKMKFKQAEKAKLDAPIKEKWEHGAMVILPIEVIEPNPWNPNEFTPEMFNKLSENIEEIDMIQPILVVPLPKKKGKPQMYRIVDGENRYEALRLRDSTKIRAVIADPEKFTEKEQMRQTVRMNKIHGELNIKNLQLWPI